jgi:chromosome segregation ATPase
MQNIDEIAETVQGF